MIEPWNTGPSQFNKRDYHVLYNMLPEGNILRSYLREAKFRDKKFRRKISFSGRYKQIPSMPVEFHLTSEEKVFYCPLEDLPLYINVKAITAQYILKWRFLLNK